MPLMSIVFQCWHHWWCLLVVQCVYFFVSECTCHHCLWTMLENTLHIHLLLCYSLEKMLWLVQSMSHAHTLPVRSLEYLVAQYFSLLGGEGLLLPFGILSKHDRILWISRKMSTNHADCLKVACSALSHKINFQLSKKLPLPSYFILFLLCHIFPFLDESNFPFEYFLKLILEILGQLVKCLPCNYKDQNLVLRHLKSRDGRIHLLSEHQRGWDWWVFGVW